MYDIWFLRCYNISVSLFVCSRFCVVTGCKNNENLTLSCSLHPKKWEQIIQNWKEWHKTFINYGVNIFGILKISWKMAELEGGYFIAWLNGHPVYPMYSLNSEFQVPSTKIGGPALKRGQFYPQNPSLRGGRG